MRRTLVRSSLVFALCTVAAGADATWAQEAASPLKEEAKPIQQRAAADVVEPASIEALKAMSTYLAGLTDFTLKTDFSADLTLDKSQKVEILGNSTYEVHRPDGLHVHLASDLGQRDFIYDGKVLTVVDPVEKAYAQVDVAPTIKGMLEQVAYHLGIELPLADLFDFGTDDAAQNAITEGFFVSDSMVNGTPAKHWAYRTEGKDFEVWIQQGDAPAPLKLVINDDTDPSRPKFDTELQWSTDTAIPSDAFTFTAPGDYEQIDFLMATPEGETK